MPRCTDCPKDISTTKDGSVRKHMRNVWLGGANYRTEPCPGSGKPAAFVVVVPKLADISAEDRKARRIPDMSAKVPIYMLALDVPWPTKRRPLVWATCPRCGKKMRAPGGHVSPGTRSLCR